MITKKSISDLINQAIEGTDIFLVDLIISPSNQMIVEIDKVPAISIKECVSVSRHIERSLDREVEDFELSVTSPGLDKPFKKIEQYQKNEKHKFNKDGYYITIFFDFLKKCSSK